jgi:hypothetical protein
VIVRKDLSPSQRAVQAIHAVIELSPSHDEVHPHVVLCGVKSEIQLRKAYEKHKNQGFLCKAFYEPDINDEMTAFAVGPVCGQDRNQFRRYNLI